MKEISSSFETTTTTTTTIYCGQRVSSVVDLKFCLRDEETRFTNRGRNNKVEFDRVENESLKFKSRQGQICFRNLNLAAFEGRI